MNRNSIRIWKLASFSLILVLSCSEAPERVHTHLAATGEQADAIPETRPLPTQPIVSVPASPSPQTSAGTSEATPETDPKVLALQAMLEAKRVVTEITVTEGKAWGTSETNRIEVYVAVDANGKMIIPANVKSRELAANVDAAKDLKFQSAAGPLDTVHSILKVCNKSKKTLLLHAQPNQPFFHGNNDISMGGCEQFLMDNAQPAKDGETYDHYSGSSNNKSSWIYFKLIKIGPDGKPFG